MSTGMQGETIWAADANSTNVALFRFAKMVSGNKFDRCGAGESSVGTFIEVNGTDGPCSVQLDRVGKVMLAANLAAGADVESDGSGKAVALSSGKKAGTLLLGGSSGDIVPVKLT